MQRDSAAGRVADCDGALAGNSQSLEAPYQEDSSEAAKNHLKRLQQLSSKEDLLTYFETHQELLDTINLATVLYRLARLYSFIQAPDQKSVWKTELLNHPAFALLLRVIHSHLVKAQSLVATQAQVPGLNARCMSNLLWSIVKLEVHEEQGHMVVDLVVELNSVSAPLVLHFLPDCTGQGLGNLLWSYARMPESPTGVLTAIVTRLVDLLENCAGTHALDSQALSNSLWSITHLRSQSHKVDQEESWQGVVTRFLLLAANHCINMLSSANRPTTAGPNGGPSNDGQFSYQAMVSIAWSFSMILGSACGSQEPIKTLFLMIRQRATTRLHAIITASLNSRLASRPSTGNMNEQTLANLVDAYQRAGLLSAELLQAVFEVAGLRLLRSLNDPSMVVGFKLEELDVLLRACELPTANPRSFLLSLDRLLTQAPSTLPYPLEDLIALRTAVHSRMAERLQQPLNTLPPALPPQQPALLPTGPPVQLLPGTVPRHLQQTATATALAPGLAALGTSGLNTLGLRVANAYDVGLPLARFASAPENTLNSWLLDSDGLSAASSQLLATTPEPGLSPFNSPNIPTRVQPTASTSSVPQPTPENLTVQQIWVVGPDGQLQPVNVLVAPSQQLGVNYPAASYPPATFRGLLQ